MRFCSSSFVSLSDVLVAGLLGTCVVTLLGCSASPDESGAAGRFGVSQGDAGASQTPGLPVSAQSGVTSPTPNVAPCIPGQQDCGSGGSGFEGAGGSAGSENGAGGTSPGDTTPLPTPTPVLPTPSVAPSPTPSLTPGPTSTPLVTPVPEPTASPSFTPEPTAAPTVTPGPTAAPTATPGSTAAPTATPGSTAAPTPTATPATGECTNVRPTGTEWDEATCAQWASETTQCNAAWMVDNNYCNQSCGRCSGGSSGPSTIPNTCTQAGQQVCNNQTGTHCGYTYEYWKDQGSGCLTNTSDGFSVNWNNINNLLGRKGVRPGSANNVVIYDADYQPNGNSYLCVYGWTRGPLVEYYIVDSWGTFRPPGSGHMGTVQSDGGTYDIYRTQRVNQPSIDGPATFYQYWSVRTQKRTSGTITVKNHFDAWGRLGMNMGSMYEVSMTVEGWQSSGTAEVRMHIE